MRSHDIIGDIHGHADALTELLHELGYERVAGDWRHPDDRRLVFLGDYIDRGPEVRKTLQMVKALVDSGQALAIAGNHEYNAVCYHTPSSDGAFLRPRTKDNTKQHQLTLDAFKGRDDEWEAWLTWFKALPLWISLPGMRAVHATWHPQYVKRLDGQTFADPQFLHASADRHSPEFTAIDCVLKGPEVALPAGKTYEDEGGKVRKDIRVKWWRRNNGHTYRDMIFPASTVAPDIPMPEEGGDHIPGYGADEPPVFFGHYWLPGDGPLEIQAPNVCCLDYSIAKGGRLAAYRWDGETTLSASNIVAVG